MKRRSNFLRPRLGSAVALAGLLLLLWPAGLFAGDAGPAGVLVTGVPPADAAVIASVDGAALIVGQVREIMRVTGAGPKGSVAALDLAIESQLLYAEAVRRGLGLDPEVAAAVARDTKTLLVEQYVLSLHRGEISAKDPGSFHTGSQMSGKHGGVMSEAAQLGDLVIKLEKEAGERAELVLLPEVYQGAKPPDTPRGQLVVARLNGEGILWAEVEAAERSVQGLDPPLQGLTAMRFIRAITAFAGKKLLYREAEAALPSFRGDFERTRERLVRTSVTRRLLALEVDVSASLGEEQLRAYYGANPGRYGSADAPLPFDKARGKVKADAERDAKLKQRAALVGRLRAAAKVSVDQPLLESLGK